jgi:hypothetical protein
MDYSITKRSPCLVCGFDSFGRDGWFLVAENSWLDRLRIFDWHPSLASENGFRSICGREHLNVLIGYWLEQGNLRCLSSAEERLPAASDSGISGGSKDFAPVAKLIGELSVYREGSSHVWAGSPATLESILDALVPADIPSPTCPANRAKPENTEFRIFPTFPTPPYELSSLH